MNEYNSPLMRVLDERGYIKDCTDSSGLDSLASSGMITGYVGFDCTAPSLHVGNLVSIMMLRRLQKAGHRPIVLIGGGTSKVGDPSGKDETRKLLDARQIALNRRGIEKVFSRFLEVKGTKKNRAIFVNNAEWLDKLRYIPFLREYGRHFSVNRMLTYDSVKQRLDRQQPLSFIEFNYMVLQAYDFVKLNKDYDCRLQMGGSDQWGNICEGIELGRRTGNAEMFGLTTHLLTTASGAKMGKTVNGAVWLNSDMLSSYDYWQYWRNVDDADVFRFIRLFTDMSLTEIDELKQASVDNPNRAKKELADKATTLAHGKNAALQAAYKASQIFEYGHSDALPVHYVDLKRYPKGIGILDLVVDAGLASSNSEVRRAIANNAIRFDEERVSDPQLRFGPDDFSLSGNTLSFGKKRHVMVKPRHSAMQAKYYVVPSDTGGWLIRKGDTLSPARIFPTQKAAVEHARKAANEPSFEIVLHSKEGRVLSRKNVKRIRSRGH
jgi:tyrosyl-tRNA synthetase